MSSNQDQRPCGVEVRATDKEVKIVIGTPASTSGSQPNIPQIEREAPVTVDVVQGLFFYVGLDPKGQLARAVTGSPFDRAAVSTLVATWITDGFAVERVPAAKLMKLLREAQKAEKSEAVVTVDGSGTPPSEPPSDGEPAAPEAGASGAASQQPQQTEVEKTEPDPMPA